MASSEPAVMAAGKGRPVTLGRLFLGFFEVALSSSGGALAPAHRLLVERWGWVSARQFTEILGLSQVLPGPNIVNVAVQIGARYHGVPGAVAACVGLLLAPLLVIMPLVLLYAQSGENDLVRAALRGVAAAAAGMLIATTVKVALPYRRSLVGALIAGAAFLAVWALHWPLLLVVLVLGPCGVYAAWRGWL